ncbi:MAG: hypothetical protein JXQ68_01710 [Campylobacterales bacterium]|nr:hypothetical protein [Campylobacterales bacterium]
MKKIVIIISALLLVTLGYIMLVNAVEKNVQQNIQKKITNLTNHGFDIEKIQKEKNKNSYILTFKDMRKITPFIQSLYANLPSNFIDSLQDMQVALDIQNNHGLFDDIKIEVYPIKLPTEIRNSLKKEELASIKKHLQEKTFMLHLSIDKSLSNFKGHTKDIEIKELKNELTIIGDSFSGEIKNEKIVSYKEDIKEFVLKIKEKNILEFTDIHTEKSIKGKTEFEKFYALKAKRFFLNIGDDNVTINDLDTRFSWNPEDKIVNASIKSSIGSLSLIGKEQHKLFEGIALDMDIKNINKEFISKVDTGKIKSTKEAQELLIAKNPLILINTFAVEKTKQNKMQTKGLHIEAKISTEKTTKDHSAQDIYSLLKVNGKLTLSKSLLELLSQNPSLEILFMLAPQRLENDNYLYDIQYDETLIVNDERIL